MMDEQQIWQQLVATFDTPAFMRRAKRVEEAWEQCLLRCRTTRDTWLAMPRLRLATLFTLAGDPERLASWCGDGVEQLILLHDEWRPQLRRPIRSSTDDRVLGAAFCQMQESFAVFNRRWQRFVSQLDFAEVNRLRRDYNRWYVVEKECAIASRTVAERGFARLPTVGVDDVLQQFPLLPVFHEPG